LEEGYIDPVEGNGQVGKVSLYVPKFTANRDDTLVSFYGLQGEGMSLNATATFYIFLENWKISLIPDS
jgi:hypothetical protein